MAYTIPSYIGHPGYSNQCDYDAKFEDRILETLQVAYMKPLDTEITKSINIYRGKNAWGEFVTYLNKNGIQPPSNPPQAGKLAVVCNNITPMSESYTNDFGPSEIMGGIQSIASGALQEGSFMLGGLDASNLAQSDNGILKGAGELWQSGANVASDLLKALGGGDENARDLNHLLTHPCEKIDIPTMWKGNSFSAQYELSIRLYCFNTSNDNAYGNLILAPLGALMQFCCPRSEGGKFYKWPFLMDFEIPGLVHLPLAYCSNLSVVKGGDVNDLSWIYRPNMVDLRMTINTVYGVTVNAQDEGNSGDHPTIKKELATMFKVKSSSSEASAALSNLADEVQNSNLSFEENSRTKSQSADSIAAAATLS